MTSQATQLALLSAVSVGMWSAKKDQGMWFLIVPRRQLFVFIVEDASSNPAAAAAQKRRRFAPSTASLLRQLGAHSPFSSRIHKEGHAIAFEVSFDNISGIDYSNSLVRPGRLVLEAHHTRKREFANIDSAFAYYGGTDGEATRASLEMLFGDSSPYKEQRNSALWDDDAVAAGGANNLSNQIGDSNGTNIEIPGRVASNPGLPAPPPRKAKTNLLARLGSAVGGKTTNKNKSDSNLSIRTSKSSPSSPSVSKITTSINAITTTTTTSTTSASNITIGNVIAGVGGGAGGQHEDGTEVTSAAVVETTTAETTALVDAFISTERSTMKEEGHTEDNTSSQLLFPETYHGPEAPSFSPSSSSSPNKVAVLAPSLPQGRTNLFRISQSAGDIVLSPLHQPSPGMSIPRSPSQFCPTSPSTTTTTSTAAAAAPAASKIYDFRLITVHWTDPQLPEILRPVIETNEVLLRLYESGLPTWATFFPRAGLYYRPWLRSLTWVLFYAFSFFSLAVGFYDLYKTLPGLQAVLSKMVAGMWLPPVAVLQWIEEHAQIRLSILLTYIFGKSEMFLYVVRMLGHAKRTFLEALGPPIQALWTAGIAPAAAVLRTFSEFTSTVLLPPLQALFSAFILPFTWLITMIRHVASMAGGSGSAVAASSPWLVRAIPTDTINTLRSSLAIPTRAAQSVWRSMNQVFAAFARHRLTWSRRARRWRLAMRKRIVGAFWLVIDALHVCWTWIWAILNLIVAAGKAGVARQRQEAANEAEKQKKLAVSASATATTPVIDGKKED